eukprot:5356298-Alexandrium_andersonii.AAC.1
MPARPPDRAYKALSPQGISPHHRWRGLEPISRGLKPSSERPCRQRPVPCLVAAEGPVSVPKAACAASSFERLFAGRAPESTPRTGCAR